MGPSAGWRPLRSKELMLALATVLVVVLTLCLDSQHTYKANPVESAVDICRQVALLGISTLGVCVVIIAGGIDLSIGSMIAFSGAVCASIMVLLQPEIMNGSAPLLPDGSYPTLPSSAIAAAIDTPRSVDGSFPPRRMALMPPAAAANTLAAMTTMTASVVSQPATTCQTGSVKR